MKSAIQICLTILAFCLFHAGLQAQQKGVAINKPSLDAGLVLDVSGLDGSNRLGVRLSPLANAPQTPQQGSLYFDMGLNTYRQYTGSAWQDLYNTPSLWALNSSNRLAYGSNVEIGGDLFLGSSRRIIGNNGLIFYPTVADATAGTDAFTINSNGFVDFDFLMRGGEIQLSDDIYVDGRGYLNGLHVGTQSYTPSTDAGFELIVEGDSYFESGTGEFTYIDKLALRRGGNTSDDWYHIFSDQAVGVTNNRTVFRAENAITAPIAPSDERLKQSIEVIPDALNRVAQLRGVSYLWNETAKDLFTSSIGEGRVPGPDQTQAEIEEYIAIEKAEAKTHFTARETGLIAQDLQKVLPEAVVEAEDGYLRVKYGHLAGLFVEAIKEQQTIIDAQAKRIRQLESLQLGVLARLEKLEAAGQAKADSSAEE